jgi:IS4 transposase
MIDLRGSISVFIHITDGKTHDVKILDLLEFELGAVYVMDRGYLDFGRLYQIHKAKAYFVIRAKTNIKFRRQYSRPKNQVDNILYDQIGVLTVYYSQKSYPEQLRRVKVKDPETGKSIVLLTNNLDLDAKTIANLYRYRWRIELFFKWIKQHLRVKVFWGESPNAVKTQIWVAVITYLMVAIAKKRLKIDRSIFDILQIISVSTFDKMTLNELLMDTELHLNELNTSNQLSIFDL